DGAQHVSMARDPELAARSVVIGSFGKTFHATGWKGGYALAPREISDGIRRVHQFTGFTLNSAVQPARAGAIRNAACVLRRQTRSAADGTCRDPARAPALPGQLFSAGPLWPGQR